MSIHRNRGDSRDGLMAEINITPFTDVLLVLLIIFMMLAAVIVPPGFERSWSRCACASTHIQSERIEVYVRKNGSILLRGRPVDLGALYAQMRAIARQRPDTRVSLIADEKAPYGKIIRVIDAADNAGLGEVSFVTE